MANFMFICLPIPHFYYLFLIEYFRLRLNFKVYLLLVSPKYFLAHQICRLIIGLTIAFFYLINFNENWLLSSMVFGSCIIFQMHKTGYDLFGNEYMELGL